MFWLPDTIREATFIWLFLDIKCTCTQRTWQRLSGVPTTQNHWELTLRSLVRFPVAAGAFCYLYLPFFYLPSQTAIYTYYNSLLLYWRSPHRALKPRVLNQDITPSRDKPQYHPPFTPRGFGFPVCVAIAIYISKLKQSQSRHKHFNIT